MAPISFPVDSMPIAVNSGDFNNDGIPDLVVANNRSNNVSVLLGNGLGSFSSATNFNVDVFPVSVICEDFNKDSNLDLAVLNINSGIVSILNGTGTGSFLTATNYGAGFYTSSLVSKDLNADGNKDIVVSCTLGHRIAVLLGGASGVFSAPINYYVTLYPRSSCISDFNGDGKFDIAIANSSFSVGNGNVSVLNSCILDVGIRNIEDEKWFKIYPNPTNSIIHLESNYTDLQSIKIEVANSLCQIVLSENYNSEINLDSLSPGVYFITLSNSSFKEILKVIKK